MSIDTLLHHPNLLDSEKPVEAFVVFLLFYLRLQIEKNPMQSYWLTLW